MFNTVYKVLSSILVQHTGVPIGGSLSARLASLTFIYRELTCTASNMSEINNLLWVKCRDNFILCLLITMLKGHSLQAAAEAQLTRVKRLSAKFFRMKLTLEQWGTELDFLECHLKDVPRSEPLTMHHIQMGNAKWFPRPVEAQKTDGSRCTEHQSHAADIHT